MKAEELKQWQGRLKAHEDEFKNYFGGLGTPSLNGVKVAPANRDAGDSRDGGAWTSKFFGKLSEDKNTFYHDEPWLSLMAMWGLFGDLSAGDEIGVETLNDILEKKAGLRCPDVRFKKITSCSLELQLPECLRYRLYIKELLRQPGKMVNHPYHDRDVVLKGKMDQSGNASIEGNTSVDIIVSGTSEKGKSLFVFIEAKFLSDISYQTTYVPVRNQIVRNIDSAIETLLKNEKPTYDIDSFCFLLLTPACFRTDAYGGNSKSKWTLPPESNSSRLYCQKMDQYKDPALLRRELPHWCHKDAENPSLPALSEEDFAEISSRIGWITFEDLVRDATTLESHAKKLHEEFFKERGIC